MFSRVTDGTWQVTVAHHQRESHIASQLNKYSCWSVRWGMHPGFSKAGLFPTACMIWNDLMEIISFEGVPVLYCLYIYIGMIMQSGHEKTLSAYHICTHSKVTMICLFHILAILPLCCSCSSVDTAGIAVADFLICGGACLPLKCQHTHILYTHIQ